jgi:hypothetical protein
VVERIKQTWLGHVKSSDGYTFWIRNRGGLQYVDEVGSLTLNSERLFRGSAVSLVVWASSIPDTESRPRALVVDRLSRGAIAVGWRIEFVQ